MTVDRIHLPNEEQLTWPPNLNPDPIAGPQSGSAQGLDRQGQLVLGADPAATA